MTAEQQAPRTGHRASGQSTQSECDEAFRKAYPIGNSGTEKSAFVKGWMARGLSLIREQEAARPLPEPPVSEMDLLSLLADLVSFHVENAVGECSWCEVDSPSRTTDHRPSCPWRKAQEIVHASR